MVDDGWFDLWSIRNDNPLNDAETLRYGTKVKLWSWVESLNPYLKLKVNILA